MPKPTVLELLHGLSVGGAEVLAARIARRMSDRFRFVFACLDHVGELGEALREEGFPLTVLDRRDGFDGRCTWRLRRLLRNERVDVIHAHQYTPFFYALTTRFLGTRVPILFTEHGRFHPDYPRKKRIVFNRALLRRRDRVVSVGEAVRQALINNEGIAGKRVQVIFNGIELQPFEEFGANDRRRIRNELALEESDFVAVLVGRLDYLKDHLTAVRAAERVVSERLNPQSSIPNPQSPRPGFRLLFVGEGPERTKIEAEIAGRGLQDRVKLLGTRHDVPALLNAADVCLLTSISEGIPLTLIEGMAAGLPVLSTDVGGVAEIVVDEETGLLAPSGDDETIARQMLRLVNDPDLRSRLGENGRERAHELFSEQQMHDRYRQLFDEMTGSPRQAATREPQPLTTAN